MPNHDLNASGFMDMLGKIYAAQKEYTDRLKIENDGFFNFIIKMFAQRLEWDRLNESLLKAAQENGFDNIPQALNQIQDIHGKSPLHHALQEQNFALAKQLMDWGAEVRPIERAAFEVACDSKAAREYGVKLPLVEKFHPVKNFGLVLGIEVTSVDGTFSQIAHIKPTYQIMTDSVAKFSKNNPSNQDVRAISDAFNFTNRVSEFSYSTSMNNPQAGVKIAGRIQEGKVTTIPIACKGHFMGLSVVPDGPGGTSGYLVFTNRGDGCKGDEYGTQIYRLDDLKKVDPKFINSVMNGLSTGTSHADIMKMLRDVTGNNPPIHTIEQNPQKYDNCSIANPKANIHGILLCQKAIAKGGFDKLEDLDLNDVKKDYKKYTHAMRDDKVIELVTALEKNPKDTDLNNIAKEYLKQHPKQSDIRDKVEKGLEKANKAARNEDSYEPPTMSAPN